MSVNPIDAALRAAVDAGEVPGVVAAVTDRRGMIHRCAFAAPATDGDAAPMRPDSVFRVASMTKLVTAVAVMMLVEERRIRLGDPLADHLPGYRQPGVLRDFDEATGRYATREATGPVTLEHLLTHTSGYGYWFLSPELLTVCGESASYFDAPFLLHEPGEKFTYGIGTDVLGRLFEPVSGLSLASFFAQRVFTPLAMRSSGFEPPADPTRLAALHARERGVFSVQPPATGLDSPRGGGALLSTAEDYLALLRLLLNRGRVGDRRLLSAQSVERITANGIGELFAEPPRSVAPSRTNDFVFMDGTQKFGFGLMVETRGRPGRRPAGSCGWGGIYNTYFWVDAAAGIAAVLLMQLSPFCARVCTNLLDRFEAAVYTTLKDDRA